MKMNKEYWWNDAGRGKRSTGRETWLTATLSTANLTLTDLGSNPALHGDRPATHGLSHGTALWILLLIYIIYKHSVPISQKTRCICIIKLYLWIVCREISVFGVRTINTRYGKNVQVLSVNVGGTCSYHRAIKRGALAALKKWEYGWRVALIAVPCSVACRLSH
jgi:hypothetical protein